MLMLKHIYDDMIERGEEAHAAEFKRLVKYEFAAGLNATATGAATCLNRWIDKRDSWISNDQHLRRIAVLREIELALSPATAKAA